MISDDDDVTVFQVKEDGPAFALACKATTEVHDEDAGTAVLGLP